MSTPSRGTLATEIEKPARQVNVLAELAYPFACASGLPALALRSKLGVARPTTRRYTHFCPGTRPWLTQI
jgi:hypothetical protein